MASRYQVEYDQEAIGDLERLDRQVAQRILEKVEWLSENIHSAKLEGLTGGRLKGLLKLRVGQYRVIYEIRHSELLVYIHYVANRSEAYKHP